MGFVMEGAPCTKTTNRRMAVFIFPCAEGEGAAATALPSYPLQLTEKGEAETYPNKDFPEAIGRRMIFLNLFRIDRLTQPL